MRGGVLAVRIDVSSVKDTKGASVEADVVEAMGRMSAGGRELVAVGPVGVHARATNTGRGTLFVQGQASAAFDVKCDRCLKSFVLEVSSSFDQEYHEGRGEKRRSAEPAEAGVGEERVYSGDVVDIAREVRESLVLSLPMRVLCREDCQGLCPNCGRDLNEGSCACPGGAGDVRLGGLSELLGRGDDEG